MKYIFSNIFRSPLFPILHFLLWLPMVTAPAQTLQNRLDLLLEDKFYQTATVGIAVYDLTDNQPLYNRNELRLCRPASNMKLLTAATALHYLTAAYEFRTRLSYKGTIDSTGCLNGDLYLIGGFDPEFNSADLDSMVCRLQEAGICRFEGQLYIDLSMGDDVYWGKGWSWDDDMETFQPYMMPLPLNKGVVKLKISPSSPDHAPVTQTEPQSAFIQIDNQATTVKKTSIPSKKSLQFSRSSNETYNLITISGSIGAKAAAYETQISLQHPETYVLTLFAEKLTAQLPGSVPTCCGVLISPEYTNVVGDVRHSMHTVIRKMNKESDNLNAEMLLYALGQQCCGEPSSTGKGIKRMYQMIRKFDLNPERYSIVDGSGLSNQNYLTPELMVAVLKYMSQRPEFALFKSSLPEAGVNGTLKYRMKETPAYRKVFAKTGSLTGVSTLSGYVMAQNGHTLAISIMIQNFVEKASFVHTNYIDKICAQLAE
jgi:D-alanyl-D-alanine carboxypeptidase/D-alanyl-D-alanine-endopeptidase (penicillin-binding protein 4)